MFHDIIIDSKSRPRGLSEGERYILPCCLIERKKILEVQMTK